MPGQNMSPIEQELFDYMAKVDKMKSNMAMRCTSCNKLRRGVSFMMTCEFLCMDCLLKRKEEQLNADPEYIRKERVYKMRKSIERYKCRSKN